MLSLLNRLSFKQKLFLFASLPMFILVVFAVLHSISLFKQYQSASANALTTQVTLGVENVIFELQKERGLSAGYLSSGGKKFATELQQQWQTTDQALQNLAHNSSLKNVIQTSQDDYPLMIALQERIDRSSAERKRLTQFRRQVLNLDNSQYFNYYSQLNQKLINFASQLRLKSEDSYLVMIQADLVNTLKIQELAGQERGLVNQLLAAPTINLDSYGAILSISNQLNNSINNARLLMTKDNRTKLNAFLNSPEQQEIQALRQKLQQQVGLIKHARIISDLMGHQGLMHDFYRSVTSAKQTDNMSFEQHYAELGIALTEIKRKQNLTEHQLQLIAALERTVDRYSQHLQQIKSTQQPFLSTTTIVDEYTAMHQALQRLQNQTPVISSAHWWSMASAGIELLHQMNIQLTEKIARQSDIEKQQILYSLYINLLTGILFFYIIFILGKYIGNSLINSITVIVRDVEKMAKDPNLQLKIEIKGNDELAQISTALNQMLSERTLAQISLQQASAVFEHSAEGIMVTDADNRIELVNPAFTKITGYNLEDVKGHKPSILSSNHHHPQFYRQLWQSLADTNHWEGEIWNKRKDGNVYPEYLSITAVKNAQGDICQHIGLFLDVSNHKQYEQDLWYKTNYDSLTKLPNRHLFSSRLQHAIDTASQHQSQIAVFLIDLDRFKFINELHGHAAGNKILKQSAMRLEAVLGPKDSIARIGGDEFAIISPQHNTTETAEHLAQKLTEVLGQPIKLDAIESNISASIGVSFYPEDGQDIETLLRNSETAMYQAKRDGRAHFQYFSPEMNVEMLARMRLEQRLRKAVKQSEFYLEYQPVVDMQRGTVASVEALIRWRDPEFGIISPTLFIPIAEEAGLIESLGEWILNQALTDLALWHSQGHMLKVAINVSGRQCINSNGRSFYQILKQALAHHCIAPHYLHVEITESMLIEDKPYSLQILNSIRQLGIDIYLDDFGTGYSALSYLNQFPISVIKIDKSFIDNATVNQSDAKLVKAIVMMGQSLEMPLVAEGIETEEQWDFLQALGCDYAQGYLMSKPLSSEKLLTFLENETAINRIINRKALSYVVN
ncbi:diguanylate cyclase [Shewanella sp. Choline-02u-19]|uniref:EAL domain-containing protein n=1 Tax=unclassified Shewanella TaxID=196818 RepID=UPI000C321782|nr:MULTISPECIES: EAL domain-containing protein [unclassified Shewanella]PKG58520.1 diguanylate cyclase [Shewanella sp. GutDb-MelDb]PKG74620.1 diguanylate cyclase [Shewanella sp. GutCb]PKH56016.1 diguanylate cyclase [Shewanella sp. Bg11-22]PKI30605.1 diguanylate cyclase [Shewanella sp. Choline-02u-19]